MAKLFHVALSLIAITTLVNCSASKSGENAAPPLQTATQLIDQGRYTEAIAVLESEHAPKDDPKVITTLASAYAARAGIKVEDFWGFVIGYDRLILAPQTKSDSVPVSIDMSTVSPAIPKSTVEFLKNLNVNLTQLNSIIDRIKQIPYVPAERRGDLAQAISILSRTIQPGSRLYRSVLSVIVLRSEFQDISPSVSEWAKAKYSLCDENLTSFAELLIDVRDHLLSMADDLTYAYPGQAIQFKALQSQIHESDKLFVSLTNVKDSLPCR